MARILIIEDNPTNLQLMGYLLRAFGHTVDEATDGEAGLTRATEEPDLILCDVQLPGLDGYQVARWLKSHPTLRATPLVAVTALAMVGDRDRIMLAGFDGYLPKPIEPETFVEQVEAFLTQGQSKALNARVESQGSLPSAPARTLGSAIAGSQGATILVVDNLQVNLDLARSILEPFGYRVLTANGISSGLASARANSCDLILSDVCIGAENGLDFLRFVLDDPQLRAIPVVFVTSTLLDDGTRQEALDLGAARYLTRPIEPRALLDEIRDCLNNKPEN